MQLVVALVIAAACCTDASILRSHSGHLRDYGNPRQFATTSGGERNFGNPDCPCIGIDGLEGDTTVKLKHGKMKVKVDFPADLGARCEAWDARADKHPLCPEEDWCKERWCYVDPCNCKNVADLPKPSVYLKDAKYQGKPVHFSYATCNGTDKYTPEYKQTGVTAEEIEKTCSVKVESDKWGMDGCRCIGIGPQNGTTKVSIDGKLEKFPADTGSTCKKWDEKRHPECKGKSPPSWCSTPWCYVDPCSCKTAPPPKTSSYLPKSKYQGRPIYYSYETCGGTDTYSADDKTACVSQKTSKDCSKLEKCAWSGKECLGKELVDLCKEPAGSDKKQNPPVDETKPDRPIGKGAYQDGKAVKQRTTDKNMDCENGNWDDCHGPNGDYANDGNKQPKPKSGAAPVALAGSVIALVVAMAH